MSQILVRDLDPAVVSRLKQRARRNRRSLQAEVRVVLEELASKEAARDAAWSVADEIRSQLSGTPQTDSSELIREDRDR